MLIAEGFQAGFEFDNPFQGDDESGEEETCDEIEEELNDPEGPFFQFFDDAEDFIDEEIDLQGGFSVGVFLGDDNDVKSVVVRVETPQIYVFGIPVIPGSGKIQCKVQICLVD